MTERRGMMDVFIKKVSATDMRSFMKKPDQKGRGVWDAGRLLQLWVSIILLASQALYCSCAHAGDLDVKGVHPSTNHVENPSVAEGGFSRLRERLRASGGIPAKRVIAAGAKESGWLDELAKNGYGSGGDDAGDDAVEGEKATSSPSSDSTPTSSSSSSSRLVEWRITNLPLEEDTRSAGGWEGGVKRGGATLRNGDPADPDIGHYAGYFRLNRTHDTRLFYFFFPSRGDPSSDPVVLWLTGGPGCASEIALFYENGPFKLSSAAQVELSRAAGGDGGDGGDDEDAPRKTKVGNGTTTERMTAKLTWNEFGWDRVASMIYVDQPVNTGFSYSTDPRDVRHDEAGVSDDMYDFLQVFFDAHPDFANRDLFLTGESYGGHYLPALGTRIMRGNEGLKRAPVGDDGDYHDGRRDSHNDRNLVGQVDLVSGGGDDDDVRLQPLPLGHRHEIDGDDAAAAARAYLPEKPTRMTETSRRTMRRTSRREAEGQQRTSTPPPRGRVLNLKGIAIGNGLTQPDIQFPSLPDYALQNGLITEAEHKKIRKLCPACSLAARACGTTGRVSCLVANAICGRIFDNVLEKAGGSINYYDIRKKCDFPPLCYDFSPLERFLNDRSVQEALGVGDRSWQTCSGSVWSALQLDEMRNLELGVPKLLEAGIRFLVYAGEHDLICNWLGNSRWVARMDWAGREKYSKAPWVAMTMKGKEVGLSSAFEPLTFLKVHDSGHMVPMDQPAPALEMIRRWTRGVPLAGDGGDPGIKRGALVREE
ncbi:hypothetical protein CBR_g1033 [Chara braunii]|uniref:Carboxypeptidase n=1 Tax=Chara braunii TaxID=69332 RepID=A0A388KCW9_CHABU|nr:hypothetical protein CBR_g1033 [Chara braunii]|eukprot:GBG67914.1 hypothetical protein CBR_g1033 [Chara braunii]